MSRTSYTLNTANNSLNTRNSTVYNPNSSPSRGPERRCSASLSGFAAVALASWTETCWLQTSMFCLLVFVWPRTSVPCRRHTSGLWRSSTAATLFHRQIVCLAQHIRWQEFRCRRATCLEQSSGPLARRGHYIQQFQASTQKVFVLMLLPGRNATFVNCAI